MNINNRILDGITKNCKDEIVKDFLIDILFEEAEFSGKAHWKKHYKKTLNKHLDRKDINEN